MKREGEEDRQKVRTAAYIMQANLEEVWAEASEKRSSYEIFTISPYVFPYVIQILTTFPQRFWSFLF